ncbi:MAG TPA: TonB-dependent receptor, partial [Flavitalea sp.]|nr:TonB-dependent receptor [Flavitalea sp.]
KVISSENGSAMQGVSINIKGRTQGTVTDGDGKFSINTAIGRVLVLSYIGFKDKEVTVTNDENIIIQLEGAGTSLADVVVIGYGTQNKRDVTGSVAKVGTAQLEAVPVYNIENALQGRASGVRVTQNSGNPGGRIEVRIRGSNSMIGSNAPLYVIDGFPVTGGINFLNPADVESMDILKDASATAIYGSRGANGVVIITTKKGRKGEGKIEIDSYYGTQKETKRYQVLDAQQYAVVANEWLKNQGLDHYFSDDEIQSFGKGTDWQDAIYRSDPIQNHTVTISGGSDKTVYSLSGNYFDQKGILINSSAKKGSLGLNLQHQVNKAVKLDVNLIFARNEIYRVPVDNGAFGKTMLSGALSAPPTLPMYDTSGLPTRIEQAYSFGSIDMRNPLIFASPRKDKTSTNNILANTALTFNIFKGFTFKTLLGLQYQNDINSSFTPMIYKDDKGFAADGYSNTSSVLNENTFNYKTSFNDKHTLDVLGGFTYQSFNNKYENATVSGLSSNVTQDYNLGSASIITPPTNGYSDWKLLSFLGRINYSHNSKYLLTVSVRSDGSSRFGMNNKWGVFPSGAVAWRVSEEQFMKDIAAISDFKLRASYGITGNTALSPYQSLSRLTSNRTIYANASEVIGYIPANLANPELKWETTAQLDLGFDLGVFQNVLTFTFDYYKKNTTNLLAAIPLPTSTGFSSALRNIGEIQNDGIELGLNAKILDKAVKWDVSAQISTNRNKVINLAGNSDILSPGIDIPFYSTTNIARVGQPFGVFYGYQEDGLTGDGLIKYKDTDGDGIISASDRVILGSPYPDYIFGFNSNLSYKNFGLNFFLEGVQGNNIFWATAGTHLNSFQRGQNQLADIYGNYWTADKPDPNAKYPKISSATVVNVSDRFIKDGSYIRVKSIILSYNLPVKKLNISWCDRAQLYVSGANLLTFTKYPGLDPESNTTGTDSQDIGSRLNTGIDQGAYPSARTITAGLRLTF